MNRVCCKKCNDCEMLIDNHEIVVENKSGLFPHRRFVQGVKCMKFGQSAFTLVELPESKMDDIVYR